MHTVKYKNKFTLFLALVVLFLTLVPEGFGAPGQRYRYRRYDRHHHHSKAKGALIGGAGGAAVGAIAGGGKGAIIGGAVGAGTGALIQHARNRHHRRHYPYRPR